MKKFWILGIVIFIISACTPGVYNTNSTKSGKKVYVAECGLNDYTRCKKRAAHKCNGSYTALNRYNFIKKMSDPVYRTRYYTRYRVVKDKKGHIHHIPYTYRDRYISYYRYYNVKMQRLSFTCR